MLQQTRCLIVIGYSVPQTDLTTQALIRSSLSEGNLRLVVVANPDPAARARVIDLARGAITPSTRIFELEHLRDFAHLLDETPGQARRRQRATRRMAALTKRLDKVEETADSVEDYDLDDFEWRIEKLEDQEVSDIEDRLTSLEQLEGRIEELELRLG